jgi:hypothetical protein
MLIPHNIVGHCDIPHTHKIVVDLDPVKRFESLIN